MDPLTISETEFVNNAPAEPEIIRLDEEYLQALKARLQSAGNSLPVNFNNAAQLDKIIDALRNRDFEALRSSARVNGLRLLYGTDATGLGKPEFDLEEVTAVYDAEPLFRRAVERQLNIWFKQGFYFISAQSKLTEYVTKRFREIAFVSSIPTHKLFKTVVRDLLKYSNAFLIKIRDKDLTSGKSDTRAPVVGYYPASVLNMYPRFQNGRLVSWARYIPNQTFIAEIDPRDVIHFTFDREPDFVFGKPRTLGVVEDIAALRRIEENVEIHIVKYLFPLLKVIVGTENQPARFQPNGVSEIEIARILVESMIQEGVFVGTERHDIDSIAKPAGLDASKYLEHFVTRVFTGLGVSPIDLGIGDTANRSTADSISQNLKERVMEDQLDFVHQVQQFMIAELLLEYPEPLSVINSYEQVQLHFNYVDLDNKIKMENHTINLWNNDLITHDEARMSLGYMPFDSNDITQTRFSLIDLPLAIVGAVDEPFTKEAKSAVKARISQPGPVTGGNEPKNRQVTPGTGNRSTPKGASRTPRPGTPATRAPATASQPENQYGKNPGPTKRKSSLDNELLGKVLTNVVDTLILLGRDVLTIDEIDDALIGFSQDLTKIYPIIHTIFQDDVPKEEKRSSLVAALIPFKDEYINEDTEDE